VGSLKALFVRDFPDELHHGMKIRAAIDKVSLRALIIRYCQEGLERDKKRKKKKGG
jgi:hypothetical protein